MAGLHRNLYSWGRVYGTCIAQMVVAVIKAEGLSTGPEYTWMDPAGTSAASSAELLPIPSSISSLAAHHMCTFHPWQQTGNTKPALPNPHCQLVAAFKEPRRSVLLWLEVCASLIGGLWSAVPTSAAISPTPFSHWKSTLAQCQQQWAAYKAHTHFSLQQLLAQLSVLWG